MSDFPCESRRPRDMALLLLAADGKPPRLRARDQQADLAGLSQRRRLLALLAERDPEPERMTEALAAIIEESGEPTGPMRSVAMSILQDWDLAQVTPGFWSWLVAEAIARSDARRPDREERDHVA